MALVADTGHMEIVEKRRFDDYASMKQYFQNSRTKEILYFGNQTTTNAYVELQSSESTFAAAAANGYMYIKSEADAGALDNDKIYVEYVSSTGTVSSTITSYLDNQTGTDEEVPVGHAGGTRHDTVNAVVGDTLTMTNLDSATANDLAGLTILGLTGDQAGNTLTVLSNTAASPTIITCTTTPNANWAADTVAVGTFYSDMYRVRRAWAETESPTDNAQFICNIDGSAIYAAIQDGQTRAKFSRYFAPIATTSTSYLGRVKARFLNIQADAEIEGAYISITFTPKAIDSTETSADVTVEIPVQTEICFEPCIELEPATDVIFKVKKSLNADHADIFVETAILEVLV